MNELQTFVLTFVFHRTPAATWLMLPLSEHYCMVSIFNHYHNLPLILTIAGSSGGRAGCLTESQAPPAACRSVLEQDAEPQIAPDEQLAPCMAASAISV